MFLIGMVVGRFLPAFPGPQSNSITFVYTVLHTKWFVKIQSD